MSEGTESASERPGSEINRDPGSGRDGNGAGALDAAEVAQATRAEQELARRYAELSAIHELTEAVARADTLEEVYEVAIDGIVRTLGVDRASVLVFDEEGVMRFRAWRGLSDAYRAAVDGHSPWTRDSSHARPITVADVRGDESLGPLRETILGEGIEACAFVPLVHQGRVVGKFMLYHRRPHEFSPDELRLAETIAAHVGSAVGRRLAEDEIRHSRDQLAIIFGGVADGIAVQDQAGRLVYANDAAVRQLGFETCEELLATPIASVMEPFELLDEHGEPIDPALLPGRAALRGERPPAATVGWRRRETGEERWSVVRAAPVFGPEDEVRFAVNIFHDVTERHRREDDLAFLVRSGSVLGSSLDYETTLERVARMAVPGFADWCVVHMLADDGSIGVLAVEHADPAKKVWARELERVAPTDPDADTGVPAVLRSGLPELVTEITDEMLQAAASSDEHLQVLRSVGMHSSMCAPLVARGRTLGAVTFVSAEGGRSYGPDDLALAEELARRGALAVDNARLYREAEGERARLSAVTRSLAEGVYALDLAGRVIFANPAAEAMLGWTEAELLGRDMHRTIHYRRQDGSAFPPEDCPLRAALATGEIVQRDDDAYVRKDGSMFAVSYTSAPILAGGDPTGVVLAFHDVTDRKRAEAGMSLLVEASEVLGASLDYRATLEHLARISVPRLADCCVVDVVERDREIRQVAVAAVDPRREELVRELERRFQTDPENAESPVGRVLASGEAVLRGDLDANLDAVARDAEHLARLRELGLVAVMIVPLVARGQTLGALTFLTMDSGRRYTQEDLGLARELARRAALAVDNARLFRDAEERAHAARVLAAVGDGVFMLDDRECVRLWNPAAEAVTGLRAADVLGRPAAEAIPGWPAVARLVPISSTPGAPARPEMLPLDANGRELWLSIAGVGFSDGTVYAFRDLTDERRVETLKTEFIATASHELRTPLSAVYGAAMTLRRRDVVLDDGLRERLLDVISEESDRLARTITDILWASRLEAGRLELSDEGFEPVALAHQVIDAAGTHLPQGVVVELVAPEALPEVAADADKVRQVLANLLDNAVKYSPDGGAVEVRLETRERRLRVAVRDEGLGIPPAEQSRIFEKFYRLDPNLTRGVGGTGLGLYICRELVRHLGGRIWVASSEGEGSTFFFELPLAEE